MTTIFPKGWGCSRDHVHFSISASSISGKCITEADRTILPCVFIIRNRSPLSGYYCHSEIKQKAPNDDATMKLSASMMDLAYFDLARYPKDLV